MFQKILVFFLICCSFAIADTEFQRINDFENYMLTTETKISVSKAKLLIDRVAEPKINAEHYITKLNDLKKSIKDGYGENVKFHEIQKHIFYKNELNGYEALEYPLRFVTKEAPIEIGMLSYALDTKETDCVPMALIFYEMLVHFGYPAHFSAAPNHLFVQLITPRKTYYCETASKGTIASRNYFINYYDINKKSIENKVYLSPLKKKEAIAHMMSSLQSHFAEKQDYQKMIYVCDLALKYDPFNISALKNKAYAYEALANQHIKSGFVDNRYLAWLQRQEKRNELIAKKLGYTPISEATRQKLLASAKRVKKNREKEKNK